HRYSRGAPASPVLSRSPASRWVPARGVLQMRNPRPVPCVDPRVTIAYTTQTSLIRALWRTTDAHCDRVRCLLCGGGTQRVDVTGALPACAERRTRVGSHRRRLAGGQHRRPRDTPRPGPGGRPPAARPVRPAAVALPVELDLCASVPARAGA